MSWGSDDWGLGPWGGFGLGYFGLLGAVAIRENVVRLEFTEAPRFTQLSDPHDGANPERYQVVPVSGTTGLDGRPARPVTPVFAAVAPVAESGGRFIDVTVDRPFTPYPSRYIASANLLESMVTAALLDPAHSSFEFYGVHRRIIPPSTQTAVARRDFANPQSLEALIESGTQDSMLLASYLPDETGDYAIDEGETSFRKRIFRRLTTQKGRYRHMPGYGLSIPQSIKRLALPGLREALAADAEDQIRQEPETKQVSVMVLRMRDRPDVAVLRVRVRATFNDKPLNVDVPVAAGG